MNKVLRHSFLIVGIIIFIAVITRIFFLQYQYCIESDGVSFSTSGFNLFHGSGYTNHLGAPELLKSPLYPISVGIVSLFISDKEISARIVSVIAGSLWIIPCFLLGSRLWGKNIGYLSALIVASLPIFIKFSTHALSEALYILWLTCGICFGYICMTEDKKKNFALAGFFFGLAILTRSEGTLFLLIFTSLVLGKEWTQGRISKWKHWSLNLSCTIAVYLILLSPYILFVHHHTGVWTLMNQASYAAKIVDSYASERDRPKAYEKVIHELSEDGTKVRMLGPGGGHYDISFFSLLLNKPKDILRVYGSNLYLLFEKIFYQLFPLSVLVLLILGLLGKPYDRESLLTSGYLLAYIVPVCILFPLVNIDFRKILPMAPLMVLWAALGIERLVDISQKSLKNLSSWTIPDSFKTYMLYTVGLGISLLLAIQTYAEINVPSKFRLGTMYADPNRAVFKEAGQWLSENSQQDDIVMARAPLVTFYADRTFRPFPYTVQIEKLRYYIETNDIRFIILDRSVVNEERRGELRYLFKWFAGEELPSWLSVKKRFERSTHKILILAVGEG